MYKLSYEDGLPERGRPEYSLGRSIHRAIELFHLHEPPPAPLKDLLRYLAENWDREGYSSKEQEKDWKDQAREILTRFHREEIKHYERPFAVEHSFNVTIDGIPLVGRIDLIRRQEDGTLEVLDYKSGRNRYTIEDVKGNSQLGIYQMAVEKDLNREVSKLTIHQVRFGDRLSVPALDREEKEDLRRALITTARLIKAKMFEPRLGEDCPCDWPEHCPYFLDLFKGEGQTTLMAHDQASVAGPKGDIEGIVREYAKLMEEGGSGSHRSKELEVSMRKYCQETGALRIFADDIAVTMVCDTDPSEDDWHWRFEVGPAPRLDR
jgi:RecB family exonuclease